jgi:hypothetical protein
MKRSRVILKDLLKGFPEKKTVPDLFPFFFLFFSGRKVIAAPGFRGKIWSRTYLPRILQGGLGGRGRVIAAPQRSLTSTRWLTE